MGLGSRFASRPFPKSVILASCNFVGRGAFVAFYACSNFLSSSLIDKILIASNAVLLAIR